MGPETAPARPRASVSTNRLRSRGPIFKRLGACLVKEAHADAHDGEFCVRRIGTGAS